MTENIKLSTSLQLLAHTFTEIPFNRMLGLHLHDVTDNHVTMSFNMKEELIGNFLQGILHGGVISSVLDMAGGMAAMVDAINKNPSLSVEELIDVVGKCSTVDLQISYLRPGRGEIFIATAWLIKSGKKLSFARMELKNQDDVFIATGSATYLLK